MIKKKEKFTTVGEAHLSPMYLTKGDSFQVNYNGMLDLDIIKIINDYISLQSNE